MHRSHRSVTPCHSLGTWAKWCLIAAALLGCSEPLTRPSSQKSQWDKPSKNISDGSFGGNAHFFFLPPLLAQPTYSGESDAGQSPTVVVCEWDGSSCGVIVASFVRGEAPDGAITYDATAEQYHVNWDTHVCIQGACTLDPNKTYRLRVLVGPYAYELGHADLDVVSTAAQLKNVQTGEFIGLVNGRTLPIKFRIETGAYVPVASVNVSPSAVQLAPSSPGNTAQLSATVTGADGSLLLDRIVTWASSDASVAIVDGSGMVTSVAPGKATISATAEGQTGTASVNVGDAVYTIVFQSVSPNDPSVVQIVSQRTDGSDRRVLRSVEAQPVPTIPRFSPDATRIVYQWGADQWADIFIMNADGSDAVNLTTDTPFTNAGPSFSPDGSKIVFMSRRGSGQGGGADLWTMNADGTNAVQLTFDGQNGTPAYSPDGRQVAFVRGNTAGGRDVWIIDVQSAPDGTRAQRQVTAIPGLAMFPRWSPDGTKLTFSREGSVFIVDSGADHAPITSMTPVSPTAGTFDFSDWSPDGKKIVMTNSSTYDLYLVNTDGSRLTRIPTPDGWDESYPSFKPVP
jgi:Tol biopolymer transport system component